MSQLSCRLCARNRRLRRRALLWCTLSLPLGALAPSAADAATNELRLARYTSAAALPDDAQLDPLEAIVRVTFPRGDVRSVGEAVSYLLLRTGYRLPPASEWDPAVQTVLALPLPEVHRQVGPVSVRSALDVLMGSAYRLQVDEAARVVSYRRSASGSALAATPANAGGPR